MGALHREAPQAEAAIPTSDRRAKRAKPACAGWESVRAGGPRRASAGPRSAAGVPRRDGHAADIPRRTYRGGHTAADIPRRAYRGGHTAGGIPRGASRAAGPARTGVRALQQREVTQPTTHNPQPPAPCTLQPATVRPATRNPQPATDYPTASRYTPAPNTGPSAHTSRSPQWHWPQTPRPQRMTRSTLTWQGMPSARARWATARSIGSGPQA